MPNVLRFICPKGQRDNKIDADDKLFNNIKDGKSFHIAELNRWFDEWYTEKLHTVVYAQYKDVKNSKIGDSKSSSERKCGRRAATK